MANPYYQISRDAAEALEEFSDAFRGVLALGDFEPWAAQFGFMNSSDSIKTTYPIPLDAAGYKEFKGQMKFRRLYERSLSMMTREWQDGVQEKESVITAPDFIGWQDAPANMAHEWQRFPNVLVADLLALDTFNGPLLDFYADKESQTASTRRMFANDHPYNVFDVGLGTFQNYTTTTLAEIASGAFFDTAEQYFRGLKGPNGKPLGLAMTGGNILVPFTRSIAFRDALAQDTLIRTITAAGEDGVAAVTQSNLWKGTIGYTVSDELTNQDYFYCIAKRVSGGGSAPPPWIVQQESSPKEIVCDTNDQKYKDTLEVSVSYVGRANAAGALPHGILRVQITG